MTEQRIETVRIKNVKGIKQLTHVPISDFTFVRGPNGSGKSTLIELIGAAIGDPAILKKLGYPVKNGEKDGSVSVDLTDMTVSRYWKNGKSRADIVGKDGGRYSNPAQMQKELFGILPHDPTDLMNKTNKQLLETVLTLLGKKDEFDKLEEQRKIAYDSRRTINQMKNAAKTKQEGYDKEYSELPEQEVSASELSQGLSTAMAIEARHTNDIHMLDHVTDEIATMVAKLVQLKEHKMDLETSIKNYENPHVDLIQIAIKNADETNKKIRYMNEKAGHIADYTKLMQQSNELSEEIIDIDKSKEWIIQHADMPVDGLSFGEDGLKFNGVNLDECSTAERLIVFLSISVGTHDQTKGLKVMLLQHGNNLDSKSMEYVQKFCTSHGYQTWIEIVADEPTGTGIFIEGGEIKNGA
jgi:septum formation topological specificity factor MinE